MQAAQHRKHPLVESFQVQLLEVPEKSAFLRQVESVQQGPVD